MDTMTFDIDKRSVTEGDIVEARWSCPGTDRVELTIDNGLRTTILPVEQAGSKRFRLNRSKGSTRMTITAWVGPKDYSKTIKVKVKPIPVTRAETLGADGRRQWLPDSWLYRLRSWWQSATARRRQSLNALPPDKRLATRLLMIIGAILLFAMLFPRLMAFGLLVVMVYLLWFLYKR